MNMIHEKYASEVQLEVMKKLYRQLEERLCVLEAKASENLRLVRSEQGFELWCGDVKIQDDFGVDASEHKAEVTLSFDLDTELTRDFGLMSESQEWEHEFGDDRTLRGV